MANDRSKQNKVFVLSWTNLHCSILKAGYVAKLFHRFTKYCINAAVLLKLKLKAAICNTFLKKNDINKVHVI